MTPPTFVHDDAGSLSTGATVELTGDEGRHAVVVRRLRAGERIVLTDGLGTSATCTVAEVGKASLTATVDDAAHQPAAEPLVTVVQAIPKGDRGELAVEVLTEVGADVITPWAAERCVWRGDRAPTSLAKWRATAGEAGNQARRAHFSPDRMVVPEARAPPGAPPDRGHAGAGPAVRPDAGSFPTVTELATTAEVAELLAGASVPVVLHEAASGPIGNLPIPGRGRIVVVVGPEGGISDAELAAFAAVGAEPVSSARPSCAPRPPASLPLRPCSPARAAGGSRPSVVCRRLAHNCGVLTTSAVASTSQLHSCGDPTATQPSTVTLSLRRPAAPG